MDDMRQISWPKWFEGGARALILLFLLSLPFLYDVTVPEVAGDIRWYATHLTALTVTVLGCLAAVQVGARLPLQQPILLWALLGLGVVAVISYLDTINPYRSWFFLKHFLAYLLLCFWIFMLRGPGFYRGIIWTLVLPILPISWLGICQFMNWNSGTFGGWELGLIDWARANFPQSAPPAGTFANKNLTASWLVATLPLAFGLWVTDRRWWVRVFLSVLLVSGLVLLIFGRSRASWLAFMAAGVLLVGWVALQPALRKAVLGHLNWSHMLLAVPMVAVLILAFPQKTGLAQGHGIDISVGEQLGNLRNLGDFGPRIAYNLNGFAMVADHPLTGVGIGAFHTAFPPYFDAVYPTPNNGYNVSARPQRTHNDLMQAFVELGVVGGVLHLVMVVLAVVAGWRLARPEQLAQVGVLPVFVLMGAVGLSINALGDFPLQMATAPQVLFTLFALLSGWAAWAGKVRSFGWQKALPVPRMIWFILAVGFASLTVYISQDNWARRAGAQHLKFAMALNMGGIVNDETFRRINASYEAYPYNARMHEFRGIIYMHYRGSHQLTTEQRLAALDVALAHDPYAANHMVNRTSLLHQRVVEAQRLGDVVTAERYLDEIEFKMLPRLKVVAPFSHHTYNLAGTLYLKRGRLDKARDAFLDAQKIRPGDPVSLNNLRNMGITVSRS